MQKTANQLGAPAASASASPDRPTRLTAALALGAATVVFVLSLAAVVVGADHGDIGQAADFSLRDGDNRRVTLSQLTADGAVLLVFDDHSNLGIAPATAADALAGRRDVRVVAVRPTTQADATLTALAEAIERDVVLLADPDKSVADAYAVPEAAPMAPAFAVLIDAEGRIRARGDVATCLAAL